MGLVTLDEGIYFTAVRCLDRPHVYIPILETSLWLMSRAAWGKPAGARSVSKADSVHISFSERDLSFCVSWDVYEC